MTAHDILIEMILNADAEEMERIISVTREVTESPVPATLEVP